MGGAWYNQLLNRDGVLPEGKELVWMATDAAAKQLGIKSHPIRWQVTLQKVSFNIIFISFKDKE